MSDSKLSIFTNPLVNFFVEFTCNHGESAISPFIKDILEQSNSLPNKSFTHYSQSVNSVTMSVN